MIVLILLLALADSADVATREVSPNLFLGTLSIYKFSLSWFRGRAQSCHWQP